MTKKTEKPKGEGVAGNVGGVLLTDAPDEEPPKAPQETWNAHWNVSRRLLEMRRKLRGSKLWATFEMQRTFEAFSIHALANEIEAVACDCGLISSFRVTKWDKLGNRTVVEGMVTFEDVDHGEVREYPGVGEAIDNGDKGLHKADSDARKVALINALNLGIGNDKEAEDTKADAVNGEKMGGAPLQSARAKTADDFIQPNGATPSNDSETYTLEQQGVKARAVLGKDLVRTVWVVIQNSPTVGGLDAFCEMNEKEFTRFWNDNKERGAELKALIDSKRKSLEMAGRV